MVTRFFVVLGVVSVEVVVGLNTSAQSLSTSSMLKLKVETACPVLLASLGSVRLVHEPGAVSQYECPGLQYRKSSLPLYGFPYRESHFDPPVENHF